MFGVALTLKKDLELLLPLIKSSNFMTTQKETF